VRALVFDLDGTLADSTYQHVIAWQRAFEGSDIAMPAVEIHRRIGMDGELLLKAVDRAFGLDLSPMKRATIQAAHAREFSTMRDSVQVFSWARDIPKLLEPLHVKWAIVTSGTQNDVAPFLEIVHADRADAVITGDDEKQSKPSAHPIARAFEQMDVAPHDAGVVGDSVWDMLASREAGSFGIGVLTGGYAQAELSASGAFRVYRDIGEFLLRLEEVGIAKP
jgi:HAD superfamily hydrolase (TIGR01549 family)